METSASTGRMTNNGTEVTESSSSSSAIKTCERIVFSLIATGVCFGVLVSDGLLVSDGVLFGGGTLMKIGDDDVPKPVA
jgi:hypothetical protein